MTTTIKVTAHCAADTEVRFGKTTQTIVKLGLTKELAEIVTLQEGYRAG